MIGYNHIITHYRKQLLVPQHRKTIRKHLVSTLSAMYRKTPSFRAERMLIQSLSPKDNEIIGLNGCNYEVQSYDELCVY